MIGTYSMLRTTGFLGTTHYHLLKTAVLKKVMNIAQLYMYFSVHFDSQRKIHQTLRRMAIKPRKNASFNFSQLRTAIAHKYKLSKQTIIWFHINASHLHKRPSVHSDHLNMSQHDGINKRQLKHSTTKRNKTFIPWNIIETHYIQHQHPYQPCKAPAMGQHFNHDTYITRSKNISTQTVTKNSNKSFLFLLF